MSSLPSTLVQDPLTDSHNPDRLKVGTLTYTKAGLVGLFFFLLWGDFCFTLMETLVPNIMPLQLNKLGAPNWVVGLIIATIPSLMTTVVNPFVSFRSDRLRSKWGRRIPFLAGATPFLVIFLILLGYSEAIGRFVHHTLLGGRGSDLVVILTVIGVLMVCFQFFNLFVNSVYYYLFNDVVPHAYLARMMALFRVVGTGAGSFFNYFILKYVDTHLPEIFLGAALLYLFAFTLMCVKVKEGGYPPPPPNLGNEQGLWASIKTYAAECFTHRFYWIFFLASCCVAMTWISFPFTLLLSTKVLGLDLDFVGKVGGICGIITMIMLYPAGILADRYHPLRMLVLGLGVTFIMGPLSIIFAFTRDYYSLHTAEIIYIVLNGISLPVGALCAAAEMPMYMKLLPQERYGQFCSANAMVRSVACIFGGVACGYFLDYTKRFGTDPNLCYRFVAIWNFAAYAGYFFFSYLLYLEWKRLGGLKSYVPPSAKPPESLIKVLE